MKHELKTWPEFFDAVLRGEKTYEVRYDDRGFQVGDELVLERFQPDGAGGGDYVGFDGRKTGLSDCARIVVRITYKTPGGRFGLSPNWCIMGFHRVDMTDPAKAGEVTP
jgi:hypothetical protein